MKFIIFNGSLKADTVSNTFAVCKMAQLAFEKLGHSCEIITLRDLDYEGSTDDVNDELKPHIMKMFGMDGVLFATPIWWGTHSCHIQAMLERLDFIYSWAKDNKYQPFIIKYLVHWYQVVVTDSNIYTAFCIQRQVILDLQFRHSATSNQKHKELKKSKPMMTHLTKSKTVL